METQPGGVLPGLAKAREGQLKRCWSRVESQPFRAQLIPQDASDSEPERIAAGQHHSRGLAAQDVAERLGIVTRDQDLLRFVEPESQLPVQPERCRDRVGLPDQPLQSLR